MALMKLLYFSSLAAVISTLLLGVNIGYVLWGVWRTAAIQKWGPVILLFILLHGAFWYFANIRDGYSNSIVHVIDGSAEMGLFSANSIQSVVFWAASIAIWLLGILSSFKPQYRRGFFCIMAILSICQMAFIEGSRVWLYHTDPTRFHFV